MGNILMRRREMILPSGGGSRQVPIVWSGAGSLKEANLDSSAIIDARDADVYFIVNFVEGAPQLLSTTTADSNVGGVRVILYNDYEHTDLVGYYWFDNETITTSGKTDLNCPRFKFNTRIKIAPRGYYIRFQLARQGNVYVNNINAGNYFNAHGNTLEFVT